MANVTADVVSEYSPLALALGWSRTGRFSFMVGCSFLGTVFNGFFVATFFTDQYLKKIGNVYHGCAGLADLTITAIVFPTAAVILLSGQWDIRPVCQCLHMVGNAASYAYNIFIMLVAVENFYRICRSAQEYTAFKNTNIGAIAVFVCTTTILLGGVGVFLNLDYDYCARTTYGNLYFRVGTAVLFHVVPFLVTMSCLISAFMEVQRRAKRKCLYKRSRLYIWDYSSIVLNIITYTTFVAAWIPYLIIVHLFPATTDTNFYFSVWFGLSRSIYNNMVYAVCNQTFNQAFGRLIGYCCFKNTLTKKHNRHRRAQAYKLASGDVRVQVMNPALNGSSPPRSSYSPCETREL